MSIQEKVDKATQLIQEQKKEITAKISKINVAEGRQEENLKNIELTNKKIEDLGVKPEKINDVIKELNEELSSLEKNLDDIILELKDDEV